VDGTHGRRSLEKYFFGRRVESDWKVGAPFKMWQVDGTLDVSGKVLESDQPRKLSVTWRVEWVEELHLPKSIITHQLDPLGEVVRLMMTEAHPEPIEEKFLEGGRRGWPVILSALKTLLETGLPLPEFD
jgi:uncharacterized protein YndB with AHSA1/START domain